jgi:hypothetical protein
VGFLTSHNSIGFRGLLLYGICTVHVVDEGDYVKDKEIGWIHSRQGDWECVNSVVGNLERKKKKV